MTAYLAGIATPLAIYALLWIAARIGDRLEDDDE
jgi:hypothetical protein